MFDPMTRVVALTTLASWKAGECLLCLGEIKDMPGHIAVVDSRGKVMWGYHDDNFREITDND
jgi:hypothetical protein